MASRREAVAGPTPESVLSLLMTVVISDLSFAYASNASLVAVAISSAVFLAICLGRNGRNTPWRLENVSSVPINEAQTQLAFAMYVHHRVEIQRIKTSLLVIGCKSNSGQNLHLPIHDFLEILHIHNAASVFGEVHRRMLISVLVQLFQRQSTFLRYLTHQ